MSTAQSNTRYSNRKLVVKEERIGLSVIAPTWSQRLSKLPVSFLTKMKWYLDLHHHDICIVGEAYGFTSHYLHDCDMCAEFSLAFESHFMKNQFKELDAAKEQFVEHWNDHHKDVTYSLIVHRRTLKWYDSFLRFDDHVWTMK